MKQWRGVGRDLEGRGSLLPLPNCRSVRVSGVRVRSGVCGCDDRVLAPGTELVPSHDSREVEQGRRSSGEPSGRRREGAAGRLAAGGHMILLVRTV